MVSQPNLDSSSEDLINRGLRIGIPLGYKRGASFGARVDLSSKLESRRRVRPQPVPAPRRVNLRRRGLRPGGRLGTRRLAAVCQRIRISLQRGPGAALKQPGSTVGFDYAGTSAGSRPRASCRRGGPESYGEMDWRRGVSAKIGLNMAVRGPSDAE